MTIEEEKALRLFISWCLWKPEYYDVVSELVVQFIQEFDTYKVFQKQMIEQLKQKS